MELQERLIQAGASETAFDAINCQLSRRDHNARDGQMFDVSIEQTPKQSSKKEESEVVAAKVMLTEWSPAKWRQKDVEAGWTKKHGKPYFGYKLLACADNRYKLIRKIKISAATEHDTLHFEWVIYSVNFTHDI